MAKKHFNSLSSQAIVVLALISLIPVFIIGFHVLGVDSRILKNEILQKQQSVARRILTTASSMLTYQEQLLAVFLDLHTNENERRAFTREDLIYLRKSAPAFVYVTLLDAQGNERLSSGSPLADTLSIVKPEILSTCLQQKPFISDIFHVENRFFVWLAEPFYQSGKEGILAVAYDLREMGEALLQNYPLDMNIAFVSAAGDLISYNGAADGLAFTANPELEQKVQEMDRALGAKTEGEVVLPSRERILVSVAQWPAMEWAVYVDQPADLITHLLRENFSWDMGIMLLTMFFFLLIISYWVILPITRPLVRLREAATRLRDQEDVVLTEADVDVPNNEIGELALIVVEMSHELHNRRQTLLQAQAELAQSNQILEQRVEERTNALKQATRELVKAERLAAIGQMASIISHEIRNPLAVISNATRLIKMLVRAPDAKVTKQFGIIEAEIRQANSIISEVLGYARSRDLILTAVDVNSYLKEILSSYPWPQGIELKEDFAQEDVQIKVDAEEVKQAIRNIISNAVEAMGVNGTVTVSTQVGKRALGISIADTGPGVSEEVRKKMFSPFFTTKARGTGLGLAVVGKALLRHKGKIFITSQLGKGTTFHLYFKIYRRAGDTIYGEAS